MTEATEHLRFREVKPSEAPASLDELHRPGTGVNTLPLRVRWMPGDRAYDVGEAGGARVVHQAVLAGSTVGDQQQSSIGLS